MRKPLALLMLLALVLTACAGATVDEGDDAGEIAPVQATCTQENPDCNDTIVLDGDSAKCAADYPDCNDTPSQPIEEEPVSVSGGMSVLGGLTVSEALATDATGILIVKGYLVADATGVHLCEALAESFPPQCGGTSIEVSALTTLEALTTSEGDVRWSEIEVSVVGEIVDGVLVADESSNG